MKIGIFLTNQNPVGSDMVSALENQCLMTRLARDRGWRVGQGNRVAAGTISGDRG